MRLSILECGAVGDGVTLCTDAINEAITKVNEAGGGYVILPPGKYVSGTIFLKSNVYIQFELGAVLLSVLDKNAFRRSFIYGKDLENIGIIGHGLIDEQRIGSNSPAEHGHHDTIFIENSKNLTIKDINIVHVGGFTILIDNNINVTIDNVTIDSWGCCNGDGIDFCGSKNVTISNCKVRAGDDAIGLKTSENDIPCENFTITNCVLSSQWAGIRIGPESSGDMLNITVSNCVFNNCSDGIKLQLCTERRFEDFTFTNLNMNNVLRPMFITSNSYPMCQRTSIRPTPGSFKRILINNVIAHMNTRPEPDWFENMIVIQALPESPIEDLMISNMHVITPGGGKKDDGRGTEIPELISQSHYPDLLYPPYPSSCMYIKNVARLRLTNCIFESVNSDGRPAVVAEAVDGLLLSSCESYIDGGLLRHYKVDDLRIRNCEGEITTLSPEMAKRWDAFREMSLEEERKVIENANLLDEILKKKLIADIGYNAAIKSSEKEIEFLYNHDGGNTYIRFYAEGCIKISVNDEEVYYLERGLKCGDYAEIVQVGVDLSDYVNNGENKIHIETVKGTLCNCDGNRGICIYTE